MAIRICGAPCCWGVDDVKNPYLPPWQRVIKEAAEAGYRAIELGPYGYLPIDESIVSEELAKNGISVVAGTIFDDLLSGSNFGNLIRQTDEICGLIKSLPELPAEDGQHFPAPYLTVMDWGHDERDFSAGHPQRAPRLGRDDRDRMMYHISEIAKRAASHGVRAVVHPHAGGYIEFADEIDALADSVPYETAGLVLDTGHLAYSGMDPCEWLRRFADRLDYVHFKDINERVYRDVLNRQIRFFEGCARGSMCPIGTGMLDYRAIRGVLIEIGYQGYITIEQERDPRNSDTSLRDVKQSVDFLRSIGFEV